MIDSTTLRRYASYAGLLLAAAASAATSSATSPVTQTGEDTLTTEAPEVSHHLSVRAEHDHSLKVRVDVTWDGVAVGSPAEVLVRITGDGADKSDEQTVRASDFVSAGNSPAAARAEVGAGIHCPSSPCDQGYTVLVRLLNAGPDEHVDVHWTATGSLSGEDQTGSLTVSED